MKQDSKTTVTRQYSETEFKQALGIPPGEALLYVSGSSTNVAQRRSVRVYEIVVTVQTVKQP